MNHNRKRYPLNGTFELTGRCNLSCRMCLVRVDPARIRELALRERTADEWIFMAEQAAKAGTLGLLLTGGEVMLRPDFCEIYQAIAQMGFVLTVYTNATMVTDELMESFRKFPPHKIGVTMYGASNSTYEQLCGCADGYDRFIDGIHQLSSLPSVFDVRTTIVRDNLSDLSAMKAFTAKTFGDDKVLHISRNVVPAIRGGISSPEHIRLRPDQNIDLVFPALRNLVQQKAVGTLPPLSDDIKKLVWKRRPPETGYLFHQCGAGITEYAINWAGRMYACELLTQGYTEPFKEGFSQAWNRLPEQYPANRSIPNCQSCQYAGVCETCPANRLAETGDWFGIPDYTCQEAAYLYQLLAQLEIIDTKPY